jgi:hypothetical protein
LQLPNHAEFGGLLRKPLPCCCRRLLLWPLRAAAAAGAADADEDSAAARRIPVMYPNLLLAACRAPCGRLDLRTAQVTRERQPSRRALSSPGFQRRTCPLTFRRGARAREPAAGRSRGPRSCAFGAIRGRRQPPRMPRTTCSCLAPSRRSAAATPPSARRRRRRPRLQQRRCRLASPRLTSRASYGPESRQHPR